MVRSCFGFGYAVCRRTLETTSPLLAVQLLRLRIQVLDERRESWTSMARGRSTRQRRSCFARDYRGDSATLTAISKKPAATATIDLTGSGAFVNWTMFHTRSTTSA